MNKNTLEFDKNSDFIIFNHSEYNKLIYKEFEF